MNLRNVLLRSVLAFFCASSVAAQTPILSSIDAPYPVIQNTVHIAGGVYGPGIVAYGPVNTPLILSGTNFGPSATVQFIGYKNGVVDPNTTVTANVNPASSNLIFVNVPTGAVTGLVKVATQGRTSNGMPILVTPGAYAGSCPAFPPSSQLEITTSSLSNGTVNHAYSVTLSASGGTPAYTWSITSGTLPSGLSLNASSGTISGTPTTVSAPVNLTVQVTDSSSPQKSDAVVLSLAVDSTTLVSGTVYTYTIPNPRCNSANPGFDCVGNIRNATDSTYNGGSIMGAWSFNYDTLNRLQAGVATSGAFGGQNLCWSYDQFGNRIAESLQTTSCPAQESSVTHTADYNSHNQVTWTTVNSAVNGFSYDASGNVTNDNVNQYLYDAEGRVCAVTHTPVLGYSTMTGYIYNAEGVRVAKGTITSMSCDPAINGFQLTESYVLGPGGEELSMLDGSGNWQRTNVYAAGKLIGTYDLVTCTGSGGAEGTCTPNTQVPALHFHIEDPLGTRRLQISGNLPVLGQSETDMQSLPYGNLLNSYPDSYAPSTANDSTPLHFTGKERDTESGNDYFEARYYSSSMGRFMSPDWSAKQDPVPYAKLDDPQTLNLYSYVQNNPLTRADADGHVAGVDDATELIIAGAVIGAIALEAGAQAYNRSPEGQRSLETFTSGVSESFSSSVNSVKSTISGWFSKKAAPPPAATDGKTTTGPKAADAACVTCNGRAADPKTGAKLGPSGKPQINETESTTREGAKNKALGEGAGATEHATPKVGKPHWHPTGADGEKKPTSTHHNYPGN